MLNISITGWPVSCAASAAFMVSMAMARSGVTAVELFFVGVLVTSEVVAETTSVSFAYMNNMHIIWI